MYAACVHMSLRAEAEATVHSNPEDYAMGHQEWNLETLKELEMTVSATGDILYGAVLVAKMGEEALWVIETTPVGVIRRQIYGMKQKHGYRNRAPIGRPKRKNLKNWQKGESPSRRMTPVVKTSMLLSRINWDDSVFVKVLDHCPRMQKISKTFD